jgi:hypothetical protein
MDERDFFNSRNETRNDKLSCPRCKRVNEYQMRWVVTNPGRTAFRPARMPAIARCTPICATTLIRVDDSVTCKTCGKKFDIPSQHSMVFIEKGGAAGSARRAAATRLALQSVTRTAVRQSTVVLPP